MMGRNNFFFKIIENRGLWEQPKSSLFQVVWNAVKGYSFEDPPWKEREETNWRDIVGRELSELVVGWKEMRDK